MARVAVYEANYDNTNEVIAKIMEQFPLDITGKKVFIKPNALRDARPEEGITTHPAVLKAVVKEVVKRKPATLVVGDNPGVFSYGMNEKTFKDSGLAEASLGYYQNLSLDTVKRELNSPYVEEVTIPRIVAEADIYISVPKFKTHGLTGVSCAIKNNYGLLPGGQKAYIHKSAGNPFRFAEALVDVFAIRVPDLVIVDGVLAMEGNGPTSTELRYVNKILASYDSIALDTVVSYMMGFHEPPLMIKLAAERGYGESDLSAIEIVGKLEKITGFKLPPPIAPNAISASSIDFEGVLSRLPVVEQAKCTLCERCIKHCPAGALRMEKYPVVNPGLCITCFCCQEMCPQKAIQLK